VGEIVIGKSGTPPDRHFKRRMSAAVAGVHLPSEEELLRGMSFFRDRLLDDAREYAGRMARTVKKRALKGAEEIRACLEELEVDPCLETAAALEEALEQVGDIKRFPVNAARLRCRIYRAWLGDVDAMAQIAAEAASRARSDAIRDKPADMMWDSLSWGALSVYWDSWRSSGMNIISSQQHTDQELKRARREFREAFLRAVEQELEERSSTDSGKGKKDTAKTEQAFALGIDDIDAKATNTRTKRRPTGGVVILTGIGNDATAEGKRVLKEFEPLIGKPVPLVMTPDLVHVRQELVAEYPYASAIVDAMLKNIGNRDHVWLRPTLLVGTPGCGKTRFARRFAETIGLPFELVPCGGLSDSAIGGTARRWSSGEPSIPIMAIRRHGVANPCLILDEIEKVGTQRHNGNPHDVLLGLFENETAKRWHDPYVESHCDLSSIVWLMTANSVEPVPSVLRDRCRILRFPEPGPDDIDMLAQRILQRLYGETGHDPRWATPLDGAEREALREAWPGGSIRKLERLVEGLIAARDQAQVPQ
jgi:hypothetical protein